MSLLNSSQFDILSKGVKPPKGELSEIAIRDCHPKGFGWFFNEIPVAQKGSQGQPEVTVVAILQPKKVESFYDAQMLQMNGIFTYMAETYMIHVGKYLIYGACGMDENG